MTLIQQIHNIVEQLPAKNQALILELAKAMVSPDDVLSAKDIDDIKQARAEFARGEFVRHEDIDWN